MQFSQKIFGIGLSRTGTTSLHIALLMLGISSVHYPVGAGSRWLVGDFSKRTTTQYQAFIDTPTATFFRELAESHDDARFIYTHRPVAAWVESCREHWAARPHNSKGAGYRNLARAATYGILEFNESRFRCVYAAHHESVLNYFSKSPEKVLVIDLSEPPSIGEIADFIGIDSEPISYPRIRQPDIGALSAVRPDQIERVRDRLLEWGRSRS